MSIANSAVVCKIFMVAPLSVRQYSLTNPALWKTDAKWSCRSWGLWCSCEQARPFWAGFLHKAAMAEYFLESCRWVVSSVPQLLGLLA